MVVNYWWNIIMRPWEVGFIRKIIAKLYAQDCKVFANVYYKDKGMLLTKENIGNKIFTTEEEVAYGRITTKFGDF